MRALAITLALIATSRPAASQSDDRVEDILHETDCYLEAQQSPETEIGLARRSAALLFDALMRIDIVHPRYTTRGVTWMEAPRRGLIAFLRQTCPADVARLIPRSSR